MPSLIILIFLSGEINTSLAKNKSRNYDYGFVAYLTNKLYPKNGCTGAVIASYWILNYCEYFEYVYDTVRVGISLTNHQKRYETYVYTINFRVSYPGHKVRKFPQINDQYDLQNLYAGSRSLFLDHTKTEIEMSLGNVRPIAISQTHKLPEKARTFFFISRDKGLPNHALNKILKIRPVNVCNHYFQKYNLKLNAPSQFCVDSSGVTFEECCASHAIMEEGNRLIGVVAWSTGCFSTPQPWVFTNLGLYYSWISNIINDISIFP